MEIVNGYVCRNCTDVGYAKRNIDPAHPKDGVAGADRKPGDSARDDEGVTFGGAAKDIAARSGLDRSAPAAASAARILDVRV